MWLRTQFQVSDVPLGKPFNRSATCCFRLEAFLMIVTSDEAGSFAAEDHRSTRPAHFVRHKFWLAVPL